MHTQKSDFSVMTLNLRFGLADDGPNGWLYRKKLLPHLFADHPTDFIACQEANDFQVEDLTAILDGYHLIGWRQPAPSFWQNNIIFAKKVWCVQDWEHFYLSHTPNVPSRRRDSRWPRQCTMGTFERSSHRLTCINTHFDFEEPTQVFSAKLIRNRWQQRSNPLPAVLLGDFNASMGSSHYRIFAAQDIDQNGKKLGFESAFDYNPGGTYHGFTGKPDDDCIDWILHTDGIKPLNAKVVTDHLDGAYYSDHFPVVADFDFI
jgi:endonuclease/exonuclease/phosphatase family metal-dependent hydrolase